nr:hypothetical protein BNIPNGOD_00064 [Salmonella enterica subsp. enterica serovar Typhimurium]
MLIVVHENWQQATRRDRVVPLVVVQFEEDGRKKCIEQKETELSKSVNLADFSRRAIEFFNGMSTAIWHVTTDNTRTR